MVWERHRWESHLELRIYQPWCGRLFHPEVVQPSKPPDFSTTSSSLAPMLPKDLFTVVPFYHSTTITINWKCEGITTRWFKVTFSSPSWRSLNHWKGSLNHPKRVTLNHQAHISSLVWSFFLLRKLFVHLVHGCFQWLIRPGITKTIESYFDTVGLQKLTVYKNQILIAPPPCFAQISRREGSVRHPTPHGCAPVQPAAMEQ